MLNFHKIKICMQNEFNTKRLLSECSFLDNSRKEGLQDEDEQFYIYITFFMHLADAFIQSDLQCIQAIYLLSVCVFPGNRTHNQRC